MDEGTVRDIIALNNRFYSEHAASFSATRNAPWAGWKRLLAELEGCGPFQSHDSSRSFAVLDLACGNLRFERFLAGTLPECNLRATAVDSCVELMDVSELPNIILSCRDILDELLRGPVAAPLAERPCDLSVCFGFMHHVPGADLRRRVLGALVDATAPDGYIALSCWRLLDDARLSAKAARTGIPAGISRDELDPGDCFLGWQEDSRPLRFCHHIDETELDDLAACVAPRACELVRWSADGGSGTLNRYLLLQRR